jgi:hypothetical protein
MILQTGMELSDSNSAKKAETDDVLNNETNENAWRNHTLQSQRTDLTTAQKPKSLLWRYLARVAESGLTRYSGNRREGGLTQRGPGK